jgi:uncharacterized protein YbaR (Trm112 family)
MRRDLCEQLRCPYDGGSLILDTSESSAQIETGLLACTMHEQHRYEIRDGIPDFRTESFDYVSGDEPSEYGTIVTPAVAKRVQALPSTWGLDAGCARAAYRPYIEGRYVGIDLIRPFLVDAQKRYPDADFVAGDIRRLPFKARAFDVVVASQVIEHFTTDDLAVAVSELMRTCKGILIVDTPNESRSVGWLRLKVYGQEAASAHTRTSPLVHQVRLTPAILAGWGFSVEGCVGHVSRARFKWPRLWDSYDRVARRFPWIGTNLIGVVSLHKPAR